MPTPRTFNMAARMADGRLLVAGGLVASGVSDHAVASVELYDAARDAWSAASPLPMTLYAGAAVTGCDGRTYGSAARSSRPLPERR
jgi:hypothetical protein